MSTQQLFCVAEDRHRAVLLAGFLADLGNPVEQCEAPDDSAGLSNLPALVLWTRRATQTPWIRGFIASNQSAIALVVDDVPPPAGCRRVVPLLDWPARSADASIGGLVRWLQNPSTSRVPFAASAASPSRAQSSKTDNNFAYIVIGACLLLLFGAILTSSEDPVGETAADPQVVALSKSGEPRRIEGNPGQASGRSTSQERVASGSLTQNAEGSLPAPPEATVDQPVGKSVAGEDSLSHLCRARSPEAALAWFRVLSPALRRSVLEFDCVQALLMRPDFAGLEAEFQA